MTTSRKSRDLGLVAEGYENRGTPNVPFGFVYFNDGSRVGYSQNDETPRQMQLWQPRTNGGGGHSPIGDRHLHLAAKTLLEAGIVDREGHVPHHDD